MSQAYSNPVAGARADGETTTTSDALEPDREEAATFLRALVGAGDRDPIVTFQTFDDCEGKSGRGNLARVLHGTLDQKWDSLVRLNRAGAGVFVMVNEGDGLVHDGEATCRTKASVVAVRALFVDDDSGALSAKALRPPPSIVVQSKNGIHAYWKLRAGEPAGPFTTAQETLAARFGTDHKVKDLPHVMRVPGFFHMKDPASPFMVIAPPEWLVPTRVYTFSEVVQESGAHRTERNWKEVPDDPPPPVSWNDVESRVREALAQISPDVERDAWIRIGMALHSVDPSLTGPAFEAWDEWSQPGKTYKHAELERQWRSFTIGKGITVATLFHIAGVGGTARGPGAMDAQPGPSVVEPVRLLLDDVRAPPREDFVLGTMIPFGKSSVLFGPTSVGKSALAAQIAFAFAAGAEELWGMRLDAGGGAVLVYTAEDTLDDWKRKGAAVLRAGGIDVEHALERFYVIDQSDGVARLSEVVTVHSAMITRRVARPTEEQDRIIAAAHKVGARLILVETASRLVEEEDNANFSALQSALGRIGRETGAAILITHHATKAAAKDNDSAIENARGGGSLIANARNALSLFPATRDAAKEHAGRFLAEDLVVLTHGKSTSSTRRHPSITLVRCDAKFGAVFRLPDDVEVTPEDEAAAAEQAAREREREVEQLRRLYEVVKRVLASSPPAVSPTKLRPHHGEIGVAKNDVSALVDRAVVLKVLKKYSEDARGITVCLGVDPCTLHGPDGRADPGGSRASAPPGEP